MYGSLGRIMTSELDEFRDFNGDGFTFGVGAKTVAMRGEKASILPYAQFSYVMEDLSFKASDAARKEVRGDGSLYDFVLGCQFALNTTPNLTTYAGIELFPLNEGELEFKEVPPRLSLAGSDLNFKRVTEFRRRDVLDLKFGAIANLDRFSMRGEVTIIAETSFLFGAGFRL